MTSWIANIDADSLLYKAGCSAQRDRHTIYRDKEAILETFSKKEVNNFLKENEGDFSVESETEIDPLSHAIQNLETLLQFILRKTNPDEYELFLSGSSNFRNDIATIRPYKGNRDRMAKPYYFEDLKNYLITKYNAVVSENEEADDMLGIAQTSNTILVSIDKDLDQIAGYHMNYDDDRIYEVSVEEADFMFYCQIMAGDSTDNIQGIPGIGKKKAEKALLPYYGDEEQLCKAVIEAYKEAGIEEQFLENAQLVRIRRYEGELWEPENV